MQITQVFYSKQALEIFQSEINKFGIIETGGVLLGYEEGSQLIIIKASDSGPNAIHESIYFKADADYIDMIIDMEYANSDGKVKYIGEWHTHPQINPEPSNLDLNSLSEIVDSSGNYNLLLIIGAIKFHPKKFLKQSISIIKYPDSSKYYAIEPVASN